MNDNKKTVEKEVREGERLAKVMARSGICSRREAEKYIETGRVTVNGELIKSPAFNVAASDVVKVDGELIKEPEKTRLWRYHKPQGLVTTHRDPQGRETVFQHLPAKMPRVISIGRLDLNSEGLLLLTNDGDLARKLELPATGWLRRYRVRVHGRVDLKRLEKLSEGTTIDGVVYGGVTAELDSVSGTNSWLTIGLKEGKNREIRKLMEHIGLTVTRLIRISYGPFQLGKLDRGEVEEVSGKVIKEQLGKYIKSLSEK